MSNSVIASSASTARSCTAFWRVGGESAWEMCGDPALHEVADAFFCDIHYERAVRWAAEIGRTASSLVYYVQRSGDALIKIGTSRTIVTRFADLQREHGPLVLMAAHQGAHAEEHKIHRLFKDLRVTGEWFRPELPVMEFILKARSSVGVRSPEGLPEQLDLLELGRTVRRLRRQKRQPAPVAVTVAVRETI